MEMKSLSLMIEAPGYTPGLPREAITFYGAPLPLREGGSCGALAGQRLRPAFAEAASRRQV